MLLLQKTKNYEQQQEHARKTRSLNVRDNRFMSVYNYVLVIKCIPIKMNVLSLALSLRFGFSFLIFADAHLYYYF